MAGIGKLTVLRYDNQGDPHRRSGDVHRLGYATSGAIGARTSWNDLVLIAQSCKAIP